MENANKIKRAMWMINSICNFDCPYCFINKCDKNLIGNSNIEPIIDFLDKTGKWDLRLMGGEPFLHPKFLEICRRATENHTVSVISNISSPLVYDFAKTIDPKNTVYFTCSLHLTELEKFNLKKDYIAKFNLLNEKGFNPVPTFVMYPPLLKKFDDTYNYFKENGVDIYALNFCGYYNGKLYPASYTRKEFSMVKKYSHGIKSNAIKGRISFKGLLCRAGYDNIVISTNGDVKKCQSSNAIMGNIFERNVKLFDCPQICDIDICGCAGEGYDFAQGKPKILGLSLTQRLKQILKIQLGIS